MKKAVSKISDARISFKHALILCKNLKGKKLAKAKKFLEDLIERKTSIDGKYYPKAAGKFLELLKAAEANAKIKGMNEEKLFIKQIKADKGVRYYRPRSLWHLRGQRIKAVHLMVEVGEG